ncbi:MAG: D-alanyl-D-alanine carboxypeptidase family protein [Gammaproteobacteria bacterium]|nr:D-alanyl-D-alanine carboxypeptidase family protein [Gammaproteobacteria bacterium]
MILPATHPLRDLVRELGIPDTYGLDPFLPWYSEATELVVVEPDILGRTQRLAPDTALAWCALRTAAAAAGIELRLVSGFRGYEYQANLIRNKLRRGQTIDEILKVNAAPGYSQHHTGRALDLTSADEATPLTEQFADTAAFSWLQIHASDFGFTLPYPRRNRYGFCYEPWHWSLIPDQDDSR